MNDITTIPQGSSPEDVAARRTIIANYYREWKKRNPLQRRFNLSLKEYINIRFVSITETCTHASRLFLSTLAVLQLDAILTGAKKVATVPAKRNSNQKEFDKMIVMHYRCPGIGIVKMTVGVKRRTHEKIQYCITTLEA
ncbi:MAG: hypothetical protein II851_04325 [Bacteroidales bacterium]|nr:hypothetical protein [Bacteroidales bacterium]